MAKSDFTRLEVKDLTAEQLVRSASGDSLSLPNLVSFFLTAGGILPAKKIVKNYLVRNKNIIGGSDDFADKAGLKKNKKVVEYAICLGYAVKNHFENEYSKKSVFGGRGLYATQVDAAKQNIISPILLGDDILRQGVQIIGTTGSGKTELLKGIASQQIGRGGGLFAVFGKADNVMLQQLYAVAVEYGREQDFFVVDWTATPEQAKDSIRLSGKSVLTNSINIFDFGTPEDVINAMIKIAGLEDSDKWVKASKDYLSAIIRILSMLNEANLTFNIDSIDELILSEDPLKAIEGNYEELNFYTFSQIVTSIENTFKLVALIEKIYGFDREKFDKKLYKLSEIINYAESTKRDDIHNSLKMVLKTQTTKFNVDQIVFDTISNPSDPFQSIDTSGGGNGPFYKLEISQSQLGDLITFYNRYALILKNKNSDFNFLEALRSGKIIIFNVPGQAREDAETIGKMVMSLLELFVKKQGKAPIAKDTFLAIFDEINSWAKGDKNREFGLGNIMSVIRGLGIGGIVAHQSSLESMGKSTSEAEQIGALVNTRIVLKTGGEQLRKELNADVGEREITYFRDKRRSQKSNSDTETETVKKEFFTKETLGSLWSGQGYIIRNKVAQKMITYYLPSKRYSHLDEETIPITKTIDIKTLKEEINRLF